MPRTVAPVLAVVVLLSACASHVPKAHTASSAAGKPGHLGTSTSQVPSTSVPGSSTDTTSSSIPPVSSPAEAIATRTQLVKCHGPIPDPVTTLLQNVTLCAWVVEAGTGAAVRSGSLSVHLAEPWPYDQPSCVGTMPAWVLDPTAPVPGGAALSYQDPSVDGLPSGTVLAYCNQEVGITNPAPYPAEVVAAYQPGPGYAASSASHWTLPASNAP